MNVLDFRFLTTSDEFDSRHVDWSRAYEYPAVINIIKKHFKGNKDISIHNTSCGDRGTTAPFKEELLKICTSFRETDSVSYVDGLDTYDITTPCNELYDAVLNVSTLEDLSHKDQSLALKHLWDQVKPGGIAVFTFDYPDVNVSFIENWCGGICHNKGELLNGSNSKAQSHMYSHLNVVILGVEKTA